jgi:hypothetical protein
MTRRKRTPPPDNASERPSKRVAFEIPASLQQLSTISASLARSANQPREDDNSAIVARAQAHAQSASPPAPSISAHPVPIYVNNSGPGGAGKGIIRRPENPGKSIYKKQIRWRTNEASFPQQQTWVKPPPTVNSGHAQYMRKVYGDAQPHDPSQSPVLHPGLGGPLGPVAMPRSPLTRSPLQIGREPIQNSGIPSNGAPSNGIPVPSPEPPSLLAHPSSLQHVGKDVMARRHAIIAGLKARSAATIAGVDTRSKQNPTGLPPEAQTSPQRVATAISNKPALARRRQADDLSRAWNKDEIQELIRRKKEENEKNGQVARLARLRAEAQRRSREALVTPTSGMGPRLAPRPSFSDGAVASVASRSNGHERGQGTPTPAPTVSTLAVQTVNIANANNDAPEYEDEDEDEDEDAPGEDDTADDSPSLSREPLRRVVNDPTDPGDLRELFSTMEAQAAEDEAHADQGPDAEEADGSVSPSAQLLLALAHAAPRGDAADAAGTGTGHRSGGGRKLRAILPRG